MKILLHRAGTQFDPLLVKLFLPFFGMYPPGTNVQLSDQTQGVALEPNLRNILRPSLGRGPGESPSEFVWTAALTESNPPGFKWSIEKTLGHRPLQLEDLDLIPNKA